MTNKKPIKPLYLWLGFLGSLLLSILLIVIVTKKQDSKVFLVLLVITFIAMTIFLQTAIARTFRYKPKPKRYVKKEYPLEDFDLLEQRLLAEKFILKRAKFGIGFIKIEGKIAYKVVLIKDSETYFSQSQEEEAPQQQPTKGLDKCEKFIGFEIFSEMTNDVVNKTPDFSFQGKNVFYDGLYYNAETKRLIEPNVINKDEVHLDAYVHLMSILGLEEEKIEE